jgi:uncharacterized protein YjbJ (UPF0337 family)
MNWEQITAQWKHFGEHAKAKWSKLTDEDLHALAGKKDLLVAKLGERYGIVKEHAEKQVDQWLGKLRAPSESTTEEKAAPPVAPATKAP